MTLPDILAALGECPSLKLIDERKLEMAVALTAALCHRHGSFWVYRIGLHLKPDGPQAVIDIDAAIPRSFYASQLEPHLAMLVASYDERKPK